MDLAEELKFPLPKSYHQLIFTKAKKGVNIKRLGFGRVKDFNSLDKNFSIIKNLFFVYAGSLKNYQRMLIVDRKQAIFKVGNQVVFTDFQPLVLSLVKFFLKNCDIKGGKYE